MKPSVDAFESRVNAMKAIQGHILARAVYSGLFRRSKRSPGKRRSNRDRAILCDYRGRAREPCGCHRPIESSTLLEPVWRPICTDCFDSFGLVGPRGGVPKRAASLSRSVEVKFVADFTDRDSIFGGT